MLYLTIEFLDIVSYMEVFLGTIRLGQNIDPSKISLYVITPLISDFGLE